MLSIGKLASGQASYYERQVARGRDDYYSGRGEAPGEWAGRGGAALGLAGQVEASKFNALMAGLDPSDEALEGGCATRAASRRWSALTSRFRRRSRCRCCLRRAMSRPPGS